MANTNTKWINDAHAAFEGDVLAAWQEFEQARDLFEATVREKIDSHDVQFSYKRGGVSLGISPKRAARPTLSEYLRS